MNKTPEQEFYGDVDHSRYRANWSCLAWFFVVGIIVVIAAWYLARHFGLW